MIRNLLTATAIVGLLAGCKAAPKETVTGDTSTTTTDQTTQVANTDPNNPDSFGVVKICGDGTKIYLLTGGAASGQYAVWDSAGKGSWELLAPTATPETVCASK